MLPLTTRLAPRSRLAAEGSEILWLRTTLEGTTQSDCRAESRLVSLLVSESIRPSATGSFAGSLPILSKGRTATCFSGAFEETRPTANWRRGGITRKGPVMKTKASAKTESWRRRPFCGTGGCAGADVAQRGSEAWDRTSFHAAEKFALRTVGSSGGALDEVSCARADSRSASTSFAVE